MKQKLRIGLLIDSEEIPNWAYVMLKEIIREDIAEFVVQIRNKPSVQPRKSYLRRQWDNRKKILYILYTKIDNLKFRNFLDAFEPKPVKEILQCPEIIVAPLQGKFTDTFTETDVATIRSYRLDVMIRLGFRILKGDILKAARFGIWSFHHGDNKVNRGGPAGFWEVIKGWNETGVILQQLTENLDNGILIDRAYSPTDKISVARNRNKLFWKALYMMPDRLKELYETGETAFYNRINQLNQHPLCYSNRMFVEPGNREMLRGILRLAKVKLHFMIYSLFYFEQWIILFHISKNKPFSTTFNRYRKLLPPKDRFWADPFVISRDGKYYIFIEELLYATNRGRIAVIEMDQKGHHKPAQVVLEKNYHLSYPFLFEWEGNLYMIPETIENKTIELYRCTGFPLKWELEKVLISDIEAVDTTLHFDKGRWWMFTTLQRHPKATNQDELFIFWTDDLLSGQWKSHPKNPVVNDVKEARPAGRLFFHNGNLYRPSQLSTKHYGHAFNICHIELLSESDYSEKVVTTIFPEWESRLHSTHTLNFCEGITVSDAVYKRSKWLN